VTHCRWLFIPFPTRFSSVERFVFFPSGYLIFKPRAVWELSKGFFSGFVISFWFISPCKSLEPPPHPGPHSKTFSGLLMRTPFPKSPMGFGTPHYCGFLSERCWVFNFFFLPPCVGPQTPFSGLLRVFFSWIRTRPKANPVWHVWSAPPDKPFFATF